jgi:hypothetical protein
MLEVKECFGAVNEHVTALTHLMDIRQRYDIAIEHEMELLI